MPERRSYGQPCSVARALDFVGERWTLLLVRELLTGPRRFKDLLDGLSGMGTNLLAKRLSDLEQQGVVRRLTLPPPAGVRAYELTPAGQELEPVVLALFRWGLRRLEPPARTQALSPSSALLGMKSIFVPAAARGVHARYELRVGADVFHARVDDGVMEALVGPADRAEVIIRSDARTIVAVAAGRLSPAEAAQAGVLSLQGTPEAVACCLRVFGLSANEP